MPPNIPIRPPNISSVAPPSRMLSRLPARGVGNLSLRKSTTTSTTDYGVTIRVDLGDPDDIYAKYVGCEMISEPPEALADDRYGVQIRGTIVGESFDMVALEECELLNR